MIVNITCLQALLGSELCRFRGDDSEVLGRLNSQHPNWTRCVKPESIQPSADVKIEFTMPQDKFELNTKGLDVGGNVLHRLNDYTIDMTLKGELTNPLHVEICPELTPWLDGTKTIAKDIPKGVADDLLRELRNAIANFDMNVQELEDPPESGLYPYDMLTEARDIMTETGRRLANVLNSLQAIDPNSEHWAENIKSVWEDLQDIKATLEVVYALSHGSRVITELSNGTDTQDIEAMSYRIDFTEEGPHMLKIGDKSVSTKSNKITLSLKEEDKANYRVASTIVVGTIERGDKGFLMIGKDKVVDIAEGSMFTIYGSIRTNTGFTIHYTQEGLQITYNGGKFTCGGLEFDEFQVV